MSSCTISGYWIWWRELTCNTMSAYEERANKVIAISQLQLQATFISIPTVEPQDIPPSMLSSILAFQAPLAYSWPYAAQLQSLDTMVKGSHLSWRPGWHLHLSRQSRLKLRYRCSTVRSLGKTWEILDAGWGYHMLTATEGCSLSFQSIFFCIDCGFMLVAALRKQIISSCCLHHSSMTSSPTWQTFPNKSFSTSLGIPWTSLTCSQSSCVCRVRPGSAGNRRLICVMTFWRLVVTVSAHDRYGLHLYTYSWNLARIEIRSKGYHPKCGCLVNFKRLVAWAESLW